LFLSNEISAEAEVDPGLRGSGTSGNVDAQIPILGNTFHNGLPYIRQLRARLINFAGRIIKHIELQYLILRYRRENCLQTKIQCIM
jgi:hypothetical protein